MYYPDRKSCFRNRQKHIRKEFYNMAQGSYTAPEGGEKIKMVNGAPVVPDNPIVLFIEGDGVGPDIWRASKMVFDAAVEKAYSGKKKIAWMEILAGEKAFNKTGEYLPKETVDAIREYAVAIKGPLTTPVGGGFRSINVTLRQELDLTHASGPCVIMMEYRARSKRRGSWMS